MVRISKSIGECVDSIYRGNVVAFPTETVFGLGANIYDKDAVDKIFQYKNRPNSNPLIVHISDINDIDTLVDLNENDLIHLKDIMTKLTPGPISFLLPKSKKIPDYITAGSKNVCIRIPSNNTALKFIKEAKTPICAPSANKFCHVSPTTTDHVLSEFKDYDFLVLDDLFNEDNNIGIESTIVKINFNENHLDILRPGFITPSMILSIFPKFSFTYFKGEEKENTPGSESKHYSIDKNIYIVHNKNLLKGSNLENVSIIEFGNELSSKYYYCLNEKNNYIFAMQNLYKILRECEKDPTDKLYICINKNEDNHFYISLYDRLIRCANNKILSYNISDNNSDNNNLKKY